MDPKTEWHVLAMLRSKKSYSIGPFDDFGDAADLYEALTDSHAYTNVAILEASSKIVRES